MSYGLQIFNAFGQLMFDTTREMDSYVVKSSGSASSVTLTLGDILFVKIPSGSQTANNNLTYFAEEQGYPTPNTATTQTFDFYRANPEFSGSTITSFTFDYFIISPSKNINSNENYGFQIFNEDGTIQFDSRTVGANHFQIVDSFSYPDVGGNSNYTTIANGSQYISLTHFGGNPNFPSVWSYYDRSTADGPLASYQIAGFRLQSSPIQVRAGESGIERSEEELPTSGGEEYPEVIQFFPRIDSQILIGTLS